MKNSDVYKKVTDQIIKRMQEGKFSWKRPWSSIGVPMNYVTKKGYRGINAFITSFADFKSPFWLTMKQANKLGGKVIKGEKATTVVYWKILNIERENKVTGENETKRIPLLRYYNIFNAEQIEGVEFKEIEGNENIGTVETLEEIFNNMPNKPVQKEGGDRAYYNPTLDYIKLPVKKAFDSTEKYYSTLAHELVHSTGHTDRLNRATVMSGTFFENHDYSFEELIAEIGASFLSAIGGINNEDTEKNSVAYLQSWIRALQNDSKLIFKASTQAQKAVDYILGKLEDEETASVKIHKEIEKEQAV